MMYTRKRIGYLLVYVLAVVFVFTGTVMSAQKKPTTVAELALYDGADRQQILEEGARKEGKLTFYTTTNMMTVRPNVAAFEKQYPYIKVEIWHASSIHLLPRVLEEYMAGRHVVDIIEVTQVSELTLEERGILQPFYSPNLAFIREDVIRKAPGGGAFAAGLHEAGYGTAYNTKLITSKELPKTHHDLLDPKWKGKDKVAMSTGPSAMMQIGVWLATYGEDFVRQIAKQDFAVHAIAASAVLEMVINGEYVLTPNAQDTQVSVSMKKGASIDWVPLEPVPIMLGQIVLPKRPACPHGALLFLDFGLSKEAGEINKATGYVSTRKDVLGGTTYKKYYGPFSTKQFAQWNELLGKLFIKK